MASNYPTSLDSFTNPSAGNTLDSPSHSLQHSDINDAVEALETKIGIGDSPAGSATSGQVLTAQGGGTAIWATPDADGLVYIDTISFSAVSAVNIDNVFSATYNNYRVIMNFDGSTTNQQTLRMRAAGTDASTSSYYGSGIACALSADSVQYFPRSNNATSVTITLSNDSYKYLSLDFYDPFVAATTLFNGHYTDRFTAIPYTFGGSYFANTSYDGFSVISNTGTITGTIYIYGYKE